MSYCFLVMAEEAYFTCATFVLFGWYEKKASAVCSCSGSRGYENKTSINKFKKPNQIKSSPQWSWSWCASCEFPPHFRFMEQKKVSSVCFIRCQRSVTNSYSFGHALQGRLWVNSVFLSFRLLWTRFPNMFVVSNSPRWLEGRPPWLISLNT